MKRLLTTLLIALTCISCHTEARNMNMPRIDKLFEKTKPVCFGRFVMDVPDDALLVPGPQAFGSDIVSLPNEAKALNKLVAQRVSELKAVKHQEYQGGLFKEAQDGPTPGSKTLLSWYDESSATITRVWGYMSVAPHVFIYKGSDVANNATVDTEKMRLAYVANHLRARTYAEVPSQPGVCLDVGFIADDSGKFQEIFGMGLRFPELPDVSFSVSSNKDAEQGDSFEARRAEAKRAAFMVAPLATLFNKVKTLREGKLKVQQGRGSEALFRRPMDEGQGAWHEFQFEYAGKQFDHHNPSWDATLFTGVAHNRAGSTASSLTDDEAIALWDRLMSSVRLRVPGK